MIIFDQLRISDDGKKLYINVHVNAADYFESYYLDNITIATADTVLETNYAEPSSDFIYKKEFGKDGEDVKQADLVIDTAVLTAAHLNWNTQEEEPVDDSKAYADTDYGNKDFSHDLFFVFVHCKSVGNINQCFPYISCSLQEETTLGVTFDTKLLYQRVMGYTRELANSCEIPSNFMDFILNFNAFKAAVETDHYIDAIGFYKQMFDMVGSNGVTTYKPCGCHG